MTVSGVGSGFNCPRFDRGVVHPGGTTREAEGETEAEYGPFPEGQDRPRHRTEIRLPDQPAEGRQGRARPVRRDRDRMDGAAHEATVADGERKSGQSADASGVISAAAPASGPSAPPSRPQCDESRWRSLLLRLLR